MTPHILYIGGEDHHLRIPAICALREHGFRVTAACSGAEEPFRAAGIPFRHFPLSRFVAPPWADWKTCRALVRLLDQVQPDVAHCFDSKIGMLFPNVARFARDSPRTAIIRTINGLAYIFSSRSPVAITLRPVYRTLHRLGAASTAATMFEISEDKAYFEAKRLLGRSRSFLVPGAGVDVEGFAQTVATAPPRDKLRQQFGLGDAPVVITVTRMTRQKGIPTLLRAAELVHRNSPKVRFLLVGPRESEGPLAVSDAEIARHAPYVIATGPRADVPALLRMADVFAFPTEYREGVPRVLLEAALARLPIVTTSIGGCCDVIKDRWNGLVVPTRSPEVLADKISWLLNHRQEAAVMAERADEVVRREFSLEVVVAHQVAMYRSLLGTSASRPPALTGAALVSEPEAM
jgi:glycosyltransferase involved in cell wall biosynthesis